MKANEIREIPNDHSAIYFKEIAAQLAEIAEQLRQLNKTLQAEKTILPSRPLWTPRIAPEPEF